MNPEIRQEIMNSLKEYYGLTKEQTFFDLPEKDQVLFQKEYERIVNPEIKVIQVIVKSITATGTKFERQTVEL
ncbi:hypothetical protein PP422_gp049 [Enterobacter phage vB_EhoM-IME523]|uniref:Uncharacterized protein n=1 Tax=Enterobacter phage vB_EhoM-IME523 TaxID=2596709 RepID=A0A7G3KFA8_9CAUD|nr:hypothetical protein PP422_gp049 [Enterobacter phage vB_EhoM-IME523]QEA10528.1 hypothetical protein [Enterobacter phage vB_EhoM-IME523]